MNLQNVANDTHTPHVRRHANWFIIDHFRGHELRCAEQNTNWLVTIETLSQAKVYKFDVMCGAGTAHDVLGLRNIQN